MKFKVLFAILIIVFIIGLGLRIQYPNDPAFNYLTLESAVSMENNGSMLFYFNATGARYNYQLTSEGINNTLIGPSGILVGFLGNSISNYSSKMINGEIANDSHNIEFRFAFTHPIKLSKSGNRIVIYWNETVKMLNGTSHKAEWVHARKGYYFATLSPLKESGNNRIILRETMTNLVFYIN